MTRLNTSRPKRSVPKGAWRPGGASISSKFCSSGGRGASTPAKRAMAMMPRARTAPATTTALWRVRRSCRLQGVQSRATRTVLTPSGMTSAARLAGSAAACQSLGVPHGERRAHMVDCCGHEGPDGGDARFEFQKVADGVHIAVAAPAYKVNCNTAIIESDDGVIIVDTHSKPSAARVIIERLREMTRKPVRYVINTHFHWDHWHGNEAYPAAYPGAVIVTNKITREAMRTKGLKRIQDHVRQVPGEIARLRAELAAVGAPAGRAKLERDLGLA